MHFCHWDLLLVACLKSLFDLHLVSSIAKIVAGDEARSTCPCMQHVLLELQQPFLSTLCVICLMQLELQHF